MQLTSSTLAGRPLVAPGMRPARSAPCARRGAVRVRAEDAEETSKQVADEAKKAFKKPADPVGNPEYRARLRDEYVGFGGAPDKPLRSNPFLIIIVVVAALALASKITGAI